MRVIPIVILCLFAGSATAAPVPLEPYAAGDKLTVSLPKGWRVTADLDKGLIAAQQDAARADAATLVLVLQSTATGTEDQLLDAVVGSVLANLEAGKRATLAGGRGRTLVTTGVVDKRMVGVAAVAVVASGGAAICILVAKDGEVDKLGGTELVAGVIASMRTTPASPTPVATPAPAPTRGKTAVARKSVGIADLVGTRANNRSAHKTRGGRHSWELL